LSPIRRVRIEDVGPRNVDDHEADRLQAGEEVLSVEEYEGVEAARLLAEQHEADLVRAEIERQIHEAEIADGGGPFRERDLEPVEADPAKTRAARKVGTEPVVPPNARKVVFPAGSIDTAPPWPTSPYVDLDNGTIVELWHGEDAEHEGEALSLRGGDRHFKEDRETQAELQPAREWLEANDPHLTSAGVTVEIEGAFRSCGLSLDDARRAFPNGRPSAAVRDLRTKVRAALLPIYEADRKRVLMSEVLGCSRTALHTLMRA
jgi:hypothetical protein